MKQPEMVYYDIMKATAISLSDKMYGDEGYRLFALT